jgi:hypothetical protein
MADEKRIFAFVVEFIDGAWMVLGGDAPLGPFFSKERAVDLAEGMAGAMRSMGDEVIVRVKD